MQRWVNKLVEDHYLPPNGYRALLECQDEATLEYLHKCAAEEARKQFGATIYIRGLIEISNHCRNNCYYCGIRRDNKTAQRYRLSQEEILACCAEGYRLGFRTFVLQGGEDPYWTDYRLVELVGKMREGYPDCAITLSLGEQEEESYQKLFNAGANRYLLRHETVNAEHYGQLHPVGMTIQQRVACLESLKRVGYQTGTGIMVGTPGQTVDHLVEDVQFIQQFRPEMIGLGPFLPHHATPFAHHEAGDLALTLKLLSICRLVHPKALIPATTALATLHPKGRVAGILAGANVVMPNLSPQSIRRRYELYDHKAHSGSESAQGLALLQEELDEIGYTISYDRGDYPEEMA